MKTFNFPANPLVVVLFLLFPHSLFSQGNVSVQEFQPHSGQAGKDVVWVPSPQSLVDTMLSLAKITPDDLLIDLGSGDGRTVITAAKRGTKAIGVEYNPDMVELSRKNAVLEGVGDKTKFIKEDFFEYDFSGASVLTLFLLPEINMKLRPKILEMKPGTRIITNTFTMQDWLHDDMIDLHDYETSWSTAYLWIVPAKVEGTWKFEGGEIVLNQKFQYVSGTFSNGRRTYEISEGKLRGNDFTFSADGNLYICQVNNDMMSINYSRDGKVTVLKAEKLK